MRLGVSPSAAISSDLELLTWNRDIASSSAAFPQSLIHSACGLHAMSLASLAVKGLFPVVGWQSDLSIGPVGRWFRGKYKDSTEKYNYLGSAGLDRSSYYMTVRGPLSKRASSKEGGIEGTSQTYLPEARTSFAAELSLGLFYSGAYFGKCCCQRKGLVLATSQASAAQQQHDVSHKGKPWSWFEFPTDSHVKKIEVSRWN